MGWEDIKTAPKDGSEVDLWLVNHNQNKSIRITGATYSGGNWYASTLERGGESYGFLETLGYVATHWKIEQGPDV